MTDNSNAEIQRLKEELNKTRQELEEAKRSIKVKEIELRAILAQADEVSHTDALTFLPNRRQVINSLQKEVHRADRYKTSLSISMLDIDNFKNINDSYVHTVGDQVLIQLADMMREGIRESDMVGRYGGEEFLILLPNTELQKAAELAERLCKSIRETSIDVGEKTNLTVSIGVAEYKHGEETWQKLLSRADMALYEAKNAGRDRWAEVPVLNGLEHAKSEEILDKPGSFPQGADLLGQDQPTGRPNTLLLGRRENLPQSIRGEDCVSVDGHQPFRLYMA